MERAERAYLGELSLEGLGAGTAESELVLERGLHVLHVHAEHGDGNDSREGGDRRNGDAEEGELLHRLNLDGSLLLHPCKRIH